jgi:hypothetical protein
MIKFIPRDIALWRGIFNFPPKLLPLPDFAEFETAKQFILFLKQNGIVFNDRNKDNKFFLAPVPEDPERIAIVQFSCIGWVKCSDLQIIQISNEAKKHE